MRCLICGNELDGCVCPVCGHDRSLDREQLPTLTDDRRQMEAAWAFRARLFQELSGKQPLQSSASVPTPAPGSAPNPTPDSAPNPTRSPAPAAAAKQPRKMGKALWLILAAVIPLLLGMIIGLWALGRSIGWDSVLNKPRNTAVSEEAKIEKQPVETTAPMPGNTADMRVSLITDYGDITDQSFN